MEKLINFYTQYKAIVLAIGGGLLLLIIIAYTVTSVDSCRTLSGIEKDKEAVNKALTNVNSIKNDIEKTDREIFEQEVIVNQIKENRAKIQENLNAARVETNNALENLNKSTNSNTSNSTFEEANRARCAAYDSPEC